MVKRMGLFLLSLVLPLVAVDNTLTLYVYPPSGTLDWSTPSSLIRTFLYNELEIVFSASETIKSYSESGEAYSINVNYRSGTGHTIAHIDCTLPDGKNFEHWSSLSGQIHWEKDFELLFEREIGFGILFHNYADGYIINGNENVNRLVYYRGPYLANADGKLHMARPRFIKVPVSEPICREVKEMTAFFEGFGTATNKNQLVYRQKESAQTLYFTTQLDPFDSFRKYREGEVLKAGGGCTSYGLAMLRLAGFRSMVMENASQRKLEISERLIGGDASEQPHHEVSLFSLLFGEVGSSWKRTGENARTLEIYDPALLWNFLGSVRACLGEREFAREVCTEAARIWSAEHLEWEIAIADPVLLTSILDDTDAKEFAKSIRIDGVEIRHETRTSPVNRYVSKSIETRVAPKDEPTGFKRKATLDYFNNVMR